MSLDTSSATRPNQRADARIAFLTDTFPVMSETFVGNEIRAVEALGHPVEVIAFRRPTGAYQPADSDLARRTVYADELGRPLTLWSPARGAKALHFSVAQRELSRKSLLFNGARIARFLMERDVWHIHAHFAWGSAAHAIVAARLAGATVSFVGHGTDVFGTPTDLAVKLSHADFAVATCDDTRNHFLQLAPKARVVTMPLGIDPSRFDGASRLESPARGLVFVARLIERKGLRETLDALARIPATERPTLDVVGDGPERIAMEEHASTLGLDGVRFLGTRPASWLAETLPSYRALLAPFFEGEDGGRDTGPIVAKEALASGVPVIASTYMGLKEIVDPSCGILVPPRDVPALAEAIRASVRWTAGEWTRLGHAGRRKVLDRFTLHREAEALSGAIAAIRAG